MLLFKNKRGVETEVYFVIIESLLILTVFIAFFQFIRSVEEGTSFEKIALSRDLALTVNTVQYIPYDLEYKYFSKKIDISKFNYKFEDNFVQILDPGKPLIVSYPYSENNAFSNNLPVSIENPESLTFETGDNLFNIK